MRNGSHRRGPQAPTVVTTSGATAVRAQRCLRLQATSSADAWLDTPGAPHDGLTVTKHETVEAFGDERVNPTAPPEACAAPSNEQMERRNRCPSRGAFERKASGGAGRELA